ncbi:unnamed protein product [Dibothriocephalus latus]|uniref:Uncharacterized protein n=1 Tax=Dibothriocephalus latus TaxID=60516 RepID=A0A3P7L9Y1_DIBLA|nr:unnamed protein product [Dibothriocephalus latus]
MIISDRAALDGTAECTSIHTIVSREIWRPPATQAKCRRPTNCLRVLTTCFDPSGEFATWTPPDEYRRRMKSSITELTRRTMGVYPNHQDNQRYLGVF